jgi:hypothetical protein
VFGTDDVMGSVKKQALSNLADEFKAAVRAVFSVAHTDLLRTALPTPALYFVWVG